LAHEAFSGDALNVKNININPGGKQCLLRPTIIPLNNPPPSDGMIDDCGLVQLMVYPDDHPDPKLRGKAKGIKAVLQERHSVWELLVAVAGGKESRVKGICGIYRASQGEKKTDSPEWPHKNKQRERLYLRMNIGCTRIQY